MIISTTRFGEIEVPEECIIEFANGLPGFQAETKYALFPYEPESAFSIMQSITNPDLTFLLADPYRFYNDYMFELDDQMAAEWGFTADNPPFVYTVATLKDTLEQMTVNLLAPIVVNWPRRIGAQLIIENKHFSVQQPLFPEGLKMKPAPKQTGQGG
jgi:flagellar assembly factor FliW